jgi:DNA-binding MarR family transcriptional regulator
VFLTPEGEALLANSQPLGNSVDEAFLGRLSKEEQARFAELVKKMMKEKA